MSASLLRASTSMSAPATAAGSTARHQVIGLYRSILRTAAGIPSYNHRGHVIQSARASFRANMGLSDPSEVSFAVELGQTQLENLEHQRRHMMEITQQQNTLSHNAPKPDRMYAPKATGAVGQQRRSFHTARVVATAVPSTAAPLTAASFFAGGVDPAAPSATAPLGMPQATEESSVFNAPIAATHIVHVLLTPNNTICSLTTLNGDTKAWASSGTCGFKNAKKSTYMACIAAGEQLGQKARNQNIRAVDMHISGFHKNKKAVLKGLMKAGMSIVAIRDTTPIPFNGCKPKKQRRL